MRWFSQRPGATLTTLVAGTVAEDVVAYRGTVPLYGDWELLRLVALPGGVVARDKFFGFGIRLATAVPTSSAEWEAGERLFYGDAVTHYLGDGVVVAGEEAVLVEGPFRIEPRGRRLVVRFTHSYVFNHVMGMTVVLQQV